MKAAVKRIRIWRQAGQKGEGGHDRAPRPQGSLLMMVKRGRRRCSR